MLGLGLEQIADILSRLESQTISVHPKQCVRLRHRRATCTRCADACPTHAITWSESLQIDSDKCTGCGICATVCPSGAIEARSPTNVELLTQVQERAKEQAAVVFACPKHLKAMESNGAHFIRVNCLGRLDASILVGAVAAGARSVCLMDGACAECPNTTGRAVAAQMAQTANALLQAWGLSPRIASVSQFAPESKTPTRVSASTQGVSRRAFFDLLARETTKATAITIASVLGSTNAQEKEEEIKKGELPTRAPVKQQILLKCLRRIGKPVVKDWEGNLWAQFGFAVKCNGCQMCAFFCPTGALTKIEQEGKLGVTFKIALCTNCRLCQEICYLKSVTLSMTIDLNKVVDGTVDTFLMADAKAAFWRLSPEERFEQTLKSHLGKE